jgi:polysaccharide biosynthesis/export protein
MEPMKIRQIGSADNLAGGLALFGGLLASTLLLLNLFIGGN